MRSFAFLLLSAAAAAVPASAGSTVALNGSWSGEMRQVDTDRESKYPMLLTLKGKTGTTTYPTLKCAGTLTKISDTKAGYTIYQETIKNEPGATCIEGIVVVAGDAGKVILGWYAAFEGAPALASAVLAKDAE